MDISWIESFLYGIISGLTEILPVSSQAHQSILLNLFGITGQSSLLGLAVAAGSCAAAAMSGASMLKRMRREYLLSRSGRRKKKKPVNMQSAFDWNFLKTACVPLLIGFLLYNRLGSWREKTPVVSLLLVLNGLILHVPMYLSKGNKDSRSMSGLDGLLFGMGSVLGFLPGISRVGAGASVATARGADPQQAFKWSLLLSIPALLGTVCLEAYTVASAGLSGVETVFLLKCVLTAAASYIGTGIGIRIMKALSARTGMEGFSYYCWGAALFSFILYLY